MKKVSLFVFNVLTLSGCVSIAPILNNTDVSSIDLKGKTLTESKSCAGYVLGLFGPIGEEPSFTKAINNGKFSKVVTLENRIKSYLVYAESCRVASGIQ